MSEFISRDEILKELNKMWSCNADEWGQGYDEGINKAIDIIENIDGIDATPVIRCKDCVHKVTIDGGQYNPQDIVCDYWNTDGLEDNGFCYNGVIGKYDESEDCYSLLDEKIDNEERERKP